MDSRLSFYAHNAEVFYIKASIFEPCNWNCELASAADLMNIFWSLDNLTIAGRSIICYVAF